MAYLYKTLFLLYLLISVTVVIAQEKSGHSFMKLGNISIDELKMARYDKDTSANAVVLYDAGQSYFSLNPGTGLVLNFDRHVKIKILKKSGYNWADIAVPLYRNSSSEKELLMNLKGSTFNLVDGKMESSKLTKESMFEEKNTDNWTTQKFTMPNVKEGSVIEFSYRIQSVFFFNLRDWTFQQTIPVLWSEYTTTIPEYFHYKKLAQGYEKFLVSAEKPVNVSLGAAIGNTSGTEYHWILKDVPAIEREPYMTSINNYVSKIEFELGSFSIPGQVYETYNNSWGKVSSNLLASERFGAQLSRTNFVKAALAPLIAGQNEPEKKMTAIYEYVKNNITYNNQKHLFAENNLRKVLEAKAGSSAEINLLLISMLKEAGLEANPVILSTRDNGYVGSTSFPNISKFDYVVGHVQIGEKQYLLDATEPLALPNILPVKCLNGQGLLVNAQAPRWIPLLAGAKASHTYQSYLTIGNDNSLKGKIETICNGYTALQYRKNIQSEGEKKYVENFRNKLTDWEINKFSIQHAAAPAEALKMNYEVNLTGQSQPVNAIYLNPMQNQGEKENPFKLETRKFPIDFATPIEETYLFSYTIPEGFKVEEQPKNAVVSLPENGGRFLYSVTSMGNTINVVSKLVINRPNFAAAEYLYLKEFYDLIIAKHAEQIVLKKAN